MLRDSGLSEPCRSLHFLRIGNRLSSLRGRLRQLHLRLLRLILGGMLVIKTKVTTPRTDTFGSLDLCIKLICLLHQGISGSAPIRPHQFKLLLLILWEQRGAHRICKLLISGIRFLGSISRRNEGIVPLLVEVIQGRKELLLIQLSPLNGKLIFPMLDLCDMPSPSQVGAAILHRDVFRDTEVVRSKRLNGRLHSLVVGVGLALLNVKLTGAGKRVHLGDARKALLVLFLKLHLLLATLLLLTHLNTAGCASGKGATNLQALSKETHLKPQ